MDWNHWLGESKIKRSAKNKGSDEKEWHKPCWWRNIRLNWKCCTAEFVPEKDVIYMIKNHFLSETQDCVRSHEEFCPAQLRNIYGRLTTSTPTVTGARRSLCLCALKFGFVASQSHGCGFQKWSTRKWTLVKQTTAYLSADGSTFTENVVNYLKNLLHWCSTGLQFLTSVTPYIDWQTVTFRQKLILQSVVPVVVQNTEVLWERFGKNTITITVSSVTL